MAKLLFLVLPNWSSRFRQIAKLTINRLSKIYQKHENMPYICALSSWKISQVSFGQNNSNLTMYVLYPTKSCRSWKEKLLETTTTSWANQNIYNLKTIRLSKTVILVEHKYSYASDNIYQLKTLDIFWCKRETEERPTQIKL